MEYNNETFCETSIVLIKKKTDKNSMKKTNKDQLHL